MEDTVRRRRPSDHGLRGRVPAEGRGPVAASRRRRRLLPDVPRERPAGEQRVLVPSERRQRRRTERAARDRPASAAAQGHRCVGVWGVWGACVGGGERTCVCMCYCRVDGL